MIKIGNNKVKDIYIGNKAVSKIYVGSNLVYQKSTPPTVEIKALKFLSSSEIAKENLPKQISSSSSGLTEIYILNDFKTNGSIINIPAGNYIYLYVGNDTDISKQIQEYLLDQWNDIETTYIGEVETTLSDNTTKYNYKVFRTTDSYELASMPKLRL